MIKGTPVRFSTNSPSRSEADRSGPAGVGASADTTMSALYAATEQRRSSVTQEQRRQRSERGPQRHGAARHEATKRHMRTNGRVMYGTNCPMAKER